jgi:hypothetical protein
VPPPAEALEKMVMRIIGFVGGRTRDEPGKIDAKRQSNRSYGRNNAVGRVGSQQATKKRNRTLIKAGLVERSLEKYQLTSAGQKVLDDRGVGANEA